MSTMAAFPLIAGAAVAQGAGARDRLIAFRLGPIACLGLRRDALFELADALLCAVTPVVSSPWLSLEPEFRRRGLPHRCPLAPGTPGRAHRLLLALERAGILCAGGSG